MPHRCSKSIPWKLLRYLWEHENRIKPVLEWLKECEPDVPFYEITSDEERDELKECILKR